MEHSKLSNMCLVKELSLKSEIGEPIKWKNIDGSEHFGILKEWDNGTAIVQTKQGVKAVRG